MCERKQFEKLELSWWVVFKGKMLNIDRCNGKICGKKEVCLRSEIDDVMSYNCEEPEYRTVDRGKYFNHFTTY